MRRFFLSLIGALSLLVTYGQNNEDSVGIKPEGIYLHFDKKVYQASDTAFFKAYVLQEGLLSDRSSNLFIDVMDASGRIHQQKIFPIYRGTASGSISIGSDSQSSLIIRAYTDFNRRAETATNNTHAITIVRANYNSQATKDSVNAIQLRLFPEGGSLTVGVLNTIAFEALQRDGSPANIQGVICTDRGDTVVKITYTHAGMGKFQLKPELATNYFFRWIDNKLNKGEMLIPAAIKDNLNLHVNQLKGRLFYFITTQSGAVRFDELYIAVNKDNKELYRKKIILTEHAWTSGLLLVEKMTPGIVSVTVTDKNNQPVAERIVFINQHKIFKPVKLLLSGALSKKSKHIIELEVPDSVLTHMSLSVFDESFGSQNYSTIASHFLLSNELRGNVFQPAYYFSDTSYHVQEDLDLLMLTHGWRKFTEIIDTNREQTKHITIQGHIKRLRRMAKMPSTVLLMIREAGAKKADKLVPVSVNIDGQFTATDLVFSDSATVYCYLGKNIAFANDYEISLQGNFHYEISPDKFPINEEPLPISTSVELGQANSIKEKFIMGEFQKAQLLKEVVVTTRKLSRHEELEERYTYGLFKGGVNAVDWDVAGDSLAYASLDIYNYLANKTRGLCVKYESTGKSLGAGSPGSCSEDNLMIFINESLSSNDVLSSISLQSIAYIKFIPQYFGTRNEKGGFSAALAIYLRKGEDLDSKMPNTLSFKQVLRGYSPVKEFYSPDYSTFSPDSGFIDRRSTLLWQPNIIMDAENAKLKFTFYNNDVSTHLKLVLQGVDESGRFVYEERIID